MAKDDTIENRVYLFESLASSFISAAPELLSSEDEAVRARARRALAELAYISCVVSDTGRLPAEQVRERVLCASELETPKAAAEGKGARGRKRK